MLIVIIEPSRTIILIISTNTSKYPIRCRSSVQFSSVQDGIYALGKVRMRSISSLRSFPKVTFKTVPMFVWLTMALSRPFKEDRLALPLSTPLSSRRSVVWCPWLCARSEAPQHLRSFEKQATCEGCFARQSICSVVSLHSGKGVFKGGCRPSTHSSLGFPFHFSLNSSLNRSGISRRFCCYDH